MFLNGLFAICNFNRRFINNDSRPVVIYMNKERTKSKDKNSNNNCRNSDIFSADMPHFILLIILKIGLGGVLRLSQISHHLIKSGVWKYLQIVVQHLIHLSG